ncbi:MAG: hypothetical protein P4L33_01155 [Capsulimonadaceae bacterium]|nr:hypothetical protein [Capsulimonadaceae bacterium]
MRHCYTFLLAALFFTVLQSASIAAAFTEDFSKANGPDGAPAGWTYSGFGFSSGSGALECNLGDERGLAIWQAAPMGRDVTFTANVTPRASIGSQWKIAGIGVIVDKENFWHLALVESPESAGRKHAAELTEMRDAGWLGQFQPGAKLSQLPTIGGFDWKAGITYQFRITVSGDQITGEIREGNIVRYRTGYKFDAPAVKYGRPMITCIGMNMRVQNATADIASPVADPKIVSNIPPFNWTSDSLPGGRATGFFHVQTISGIDWLVDPKGRLCFSTGTDHITFHGHHSETLGYAPYARIAAAKYGTEAAWAAAQQKRLLSWGFNVAGTGSSKSMFYGGLAHTQFLAFGSQFPAIANIVPKTTWTGFPDVFDPRFVPFCNQRAREVCKPEENDPWLLGYFIDNELEWYGKAPFYNVDGLAYGAWQYDGTHACKQKLVATIRQAYGDNIAAVNTDFGTNYASYDELMKAGAPGRPSTDKAKATLDAYVKEVADRYFDVTTAAIRAHDPNHMVIGCRFAGQAPEPCWKAAGRTCDIVTVNIYPRINIEQQNSPELVTKLQEYHALCNKPMAVTEWSFPALDAVDSTGMKIPSVHGAGMRVDTQAQKALCYQVMQRILSATPFVVGSHYFMYIDEPATGISSTFPEDSNYGLIAESDAPYPVVTAAAKRINATIVAVHAGHCARLSATAHGDHIVVANSGTVAAKAPIVIWVNGVRSERIVNLPAGGSFTYWAKQATLSPIEGAYIRIEVDPGRTVAQAATETQSADIVVKPQATKFAIGMLRKGLTAHNVPVTNQPLHPVVVWNPSPVALSNVTVRPDTGGASVHVDKLDAYGSQTLWLTKDAPAPPAAGTVRFTRTDKGGYTIDNGILRLTKDQDTGAIFDSVALAGNGEPTVLGEYWPLLNLNTAKGLAWIRANRIMDVKVVYQDASAISLDITAQHDAAGDPGFRCAYRVDVAAGDPCFSSRVLWIENTNASPLECPRYYHYTPSAFASDSISQTPTNYWATVAVWRSPSKRIEYGTAPASRDGLLEASFWKDDKGGEHPDCSRKIYLTLKPGEKWQPSTPEPAALIGGLREQRTGEVEFRALAQELRARLAARAM